MATLKVGDPVLVGKKSGPLQKGEVLALEDLPESEKTYWVKRTARVRLEDGTIVDRVFVDAPWNVRSDEEDYGLLLLDMENPPPEEALARLGKWRDRFWVAANPVYLSKAQLVCKQCSRPVTHTESSTEAAEFYLDGSDWYHSKTEITENDICLSCECEDVDLAGKFPYRGYYDDEYEAWEEEDE